LPRGSPNTALPAETLLYLALRTMTDVR
jgi:hypothetical protein